jgi:hydrogenase maturation protein HypF
MAAVYLQQAFGEDFLQLDLPFVHRLDRQRWQLLDQIIGRGLNCPPTSSLGRLFDAVASLLGLRSEVSYEGQAAIELEMMAIASDRGYPFMIEAGWPLQLDVMPTIRGVVQDAQRNIPNAIIAGRFHQTTARLFAETCRRIRQRTNLETVVLSGGVFQNRLLLERTMALLQADQFQVYINRLVPPNDGGLCLGQAAVAAARLSADL